MARKKKLDKLSLDMIQCEKDGFGCHYGRWKATQEPVKIVKTIPEGWKKCEYCGKPFKPPAKNHQRFCEVACQKKASDARRRAKKLEYMREYRARKKEM